jgi:hypothetical protein
MSYSAGLSTHERFMNMALKRRAISLEKKRYWESHLESWSRSGLSQAEYCRQNGIRIKGFGYWKRKLVKKDFPVELVELDAEQIFISQPLRIHVGAGYQVEVPDGFSRATLKSVLLLLRGL